MTIPGARGFRCAELLCIGLAALAAVACTGCEPEARPEQDGGEPIAEAAPEERPNVLLISIDTLRYDHMSAYGYDRETTPHLAALAMDGARFETAYTHTATTGPAHATMLTSLYPLAHGVDRNGVMFSPGRPRLPTVLRSRGYQTAAFVSSYVLNEMLGFGKGFDTYDADLTWVFERPAEPTVTAAEGWLRSRREAGRPFFLFVHLFDPHSGYNPPKHIADRFRTTPSGSREKKHKRADVVDRYDGEIAFADEAIGRLLETLDALDLGSKTIVVVVADHGEGLGEHGIFTHGFGLYEELIRIPMLFRWPGHIEPGTRIEEPVGLVDLMPTILDLAGVDGSQLGLQGQSLAGALLAKEGLEPERPIYLQRRHFDTEKIAGRRVKGDAFGVRFGRWKYTEGEIPGDRELYDLEADPEEMQNLVESHPEQARELAERVRVWRSAIEPPVTEQRRAKRRVEPDARARLRALGYVE